MKAQSFHSKEAGLITDDVAAEQDPRVKAAIIVQRFVRKRYYDSLRLHCKHLSQRECQYTVAAMARLPRNLLFGPLSVASDLAILLFQLAGLRYESEIVRGGAYIAA